MVVAEAVTVAAGVVEVAVVVGVASVAEGIAAGIAVGTAAGTAVAVTVTAVMSVVVLHNFMTHGGLSGRQLRMGAPMARHPGLFVLLRRVCLVVLPVAELPPVLSSRTSMLHGAP